MTPDTSIIAKLLNVNGMHIEKVEVKGYSLSPGKYDVTVYAYSDTNGSSYITVTFSTTGERDVGPAVSMDKETYAPGEAINFIVSDQDAEEIHVEYRYGKTISSMDYSGSKDIELTDGPNTTWSYRTSDGYEGYTYEFRFSAKRDGKWSQWKKISILAESE